MEPQGRCASGTKLVCLGLAADWPSRCDRTGRGGEFPSPATPQDPKDVSMGGHALLSFLTRASKMVRPLKSTSVGPSRSLNLRPPCSPAAVAPDAGLDTYIAQQHGHG
jgi:hypothetical protein